MMYIEDLSNRLEVIQPGLNHIRLMVCSLGKHYGIGDSRKPRLEKKKGTSLKAKCRSCEDKRQGIRECGM